MGPSGNWSMMMRNGRRPPQADAALAMPRAVAQALGALRQTFDPVAQQAVTGLPAHPFGSIQHNRRRPKRDDALEIPPRVKELRRVIATPLPRMRSEELRMTVDRWGGCPRAFTSRSDAPPRRPRCGPRSLPMAPIWGGAPWASPWICERLSRRGASARTPSKPPRRSWCMIIPVSHSVVSGGTACRPRPMANALPCTRMP